MFSPERTFFLHILSYHELLSKNNATKEKKMQILVLGMKIHVFFFTVFYFQTIHSQSSSFKKISVESLEKVAAENVEGIEEHLRRTSSREIEKVGVRATRTEKKIYQDYES